jgi:hypothetical protein
MVWLLNCLMAGAVSMVYSRCLPGVRCSTKRYASAVLVVPPTAQNPELAGDMSSPASPHISPFLTTPEGLSEGVWVAFCTELHCTRPRMAAAWPATQAAVAAESITSTPTTSCALESE